MSVPSKESCQPRTSMIYLTSLKYVSAVNLGIGKSIGIGIAKYSRPVPKSLVAN